jgi:HlyD family secretion protein
LNETADVKFDAIANQVFTGTVVEVNPTLQTVSNYLTVQGIVELNMEGIKDPPVLFQNLSASVTLYQGKSDNALLVPVAAIRDIGNGTYAIFVVQKDGSLLLKPVTVGLKDSTNAEILSGLTQGLTETK